MTIDPTALKNLKAALRDKARDLGFQQIGVSDTELESDRAYLDRWLALARHGDMHYMARHGSLRTTPEALVPGTVRVIAARMDYLPETGADAESVLRQPDKAYIARYALGRDYHKLMRRRLKRLAEWLRAEVGETRYRVFVDSAPVMERALARKAGLGWVGKHTNLLDRRDGSWFLLGEIYTDLPLPCDAPVTEHCGTCRACIDVCPTAAIVGPYELDARRCISYLTIEHKGPIPIELRPLIGNRIFGCDDCQLVCPWNRYAKLTAEDDFKPRHGLRAPDLVELFGWSESEWSEKTTGSALRRAGYEGWRRNIAVALGNAPGEPGVIAALERASDDPSPLVREHVSWARRAHAARGGARAARPASIGDADVVDEPRLAEPGCGEHDQLPR
ncbi:MAG TPA: tRNA epoxyqueuosine(34) reductase QueG [Gammaproteobacteria bacterium]|nr:tRNA epoxyqueuosine(34) reductase QueG [Gammaproteobacteria bacterium]